MAVDAGANVIATTRNRDRFAKLEGLGAHRVELERPGHHHHVALNLKPPAQTTLAAF
jgi:NADPH2:quinone reductase